MIICMMDSDVSDSALAILEGEYGNVYFYPDDFNDFSEQIDETLIILNLNDPNMQKMLSADKLVEFLVDIPLPETLNNIVLLASDFDFGDRATRMMDYQTAFHDACREKALNISIKAFYDYNYPISWISPPIDPQGTWKIYGMRPKDMKNLESIPSTYEGFMQCDSKTLLWEGSNLIEDCEHIHVKNTSNSFNFQNV